MATTLYDYSTNWMKGKNGSTGNYQFRARIIENSADPNTNKSNVTCKLEMHCDTDDHHVMWNANATKNQPYATLTGDVTATGSHISTYKKTTEWKNLVSWTGDIMHNSDGTKNITVNFQWVAGELVYYPDTFYIGQPTVSLTAFPRSSISTGSGWVTGALYVSNGSAWKPGKVGAVSDGTQWKTVDS